MIKNYKKEDLLEFKAIIEKKLIKAHESLHFIEEALRDQGSAVESEDYGNPIEGSSLSSEKENLSQLATRQLKFIKNLESSLKRIQDGTYGICSITGKLIDKARLRVVPHATKSLEAKIRKD